MYAETKRRTYLQLGVFLAAMGVLLTILGIFYVNNPAVFPGLATQRAAILWGGLLLVCFALRDVAIGFPATRFATDSMCDTFSAVFANLFSLLISGAVIGITLWGHIDYLRKVDVDTLDNDLVIVNLISVLFLGTMSMLAALVGCIIACFPVSDAQAAHGREEDYQMDNQGYNKH